MSETRFKETKVIPDLKTLPDTWFVKTSERSHKGILDIIMCLRGKFVTIELKRDGEEPTKLQALMIQKVQKAGGLAFYASPSTWDAQFKLLKHLATQP